jgi:hypothetical protein
VQYPPFYTLEPQTTPNHGDSTGMLESATTFAEQASAAGVTIDVNDGPAGRYFTDDYHRVNVGQPHWAGEPVLTWIDWLAWWGTRTMSTSDDTTAGAVTRAGYAPIVEVETIALRVPAAAPRRPRRLG